MTLGIVFWLWGITLGIITFVIVPLALCLLHRALRAARFIERYTREALEAGAGIATNTAAIVALDETIAATKSRTCSSLRGRGPELWGRSRSP